jgi:hypothetical protein
MSMAENLLRYLPRLIKEDCCEEVAFAVRDHDPSRYGTVRDHVGLAMVPLEVARAAVRPLAKRTGWPKFRVAFRVLRDPP